MSALLQNNQEYIQGSPEWHQLRKNKITATDASIIMGANHWKTKIQLYHEKKDIYFVSSINDRMQRGLDLEPIARNLFNYKTGLNMQPEVIVKGFSMASLDGFDRESEYILEIKCPGEKDHSVALEGKIPDHYYPQLQHQIYVTDNSFAYYFSFDGIDGVILKVQRDDNYIEKMLEKEHEFYECLMNNIAPEPDENDYIQRDDELWEQCASKYQSVKKQLKDLETQEEELKKQLIFLSGESNAKGGGISLCQIVRKGNVDYQKLLKQLAVDDQMIEKYRKGSITSWRVNCS